MSDDVRRLQRKGVSDDDIKSAIEHQRSQRRAGAPVQRLDVIVGVAPAKPSPPEFLIGRQLRKKDAGTQASTIARQLALMSKTQIGALELRQAAELIDRNSSRLQQEEFSFMAGNISVGHEYQSTIRHRLTESGVTLAQKNQALAVLWTLTEFLKWQSFEIDASISEIAEHTGIVRPNLSKTLKLLESVGAINRVQKGRRSCISITPEGIYKGSMQAHSMTVEKYKRHKLEVVNGGKQQT